MRKSGVWVALAATAVLAGAGCKGRSNVGGETPQERAAQNAGGVDVSKGTLQGKVTRVGSDKVEVTTTTGDRREIKTDQTTQIIDAQGQLAPDLSAVKEGSQVRASWADTPDKPAQRIEVISVEGGATAVPQGQQKQQQPAAPQGAHTQQGQGNREQGAAANSGGSNDTLGGSAGGGTFYGGSGTGGGSVSPSQSGSTGSKGAPQGTSR